MLGCRSAEIEGTFDTDVEVVVPFGGRLIGDAQALAEMAGVVDDDVEPIEFRQYLVDQRLAIGLAGYVRLDRQPSTTGLFDLGDPGLGRLAIEI